MRELIPRASLTSAILAAFLALAAAPVALGQENSAVDEYTENIPSAGGGAGNTGSGGDGGGGAGGGGGGGGGGSASDAQPQGGGGDLPGAVTQQFENAGADGVAAAALAEATAPEGSAAAAGDAAGAGDALGGTGGSSSTGEGGSSQGSGAGSEAGGAGGLEAGGIDSESVPTGGGGGLDEVLGVVTGGSSDTGGMGAALPLILGAALVAGLVAILMRLRAQGQPDSR